MSIGKVPGKQIVDDTVVRTINGLIFSDQYFMPTNDTNVLLTIATFGNTHSFTLGWTGSLSLSRGGLSNSIFTASQILIVNSSTSSIISSGYEFNDNGLSFNDIWSAGQVLKLNIPSGQITNFTSSVSQLIIPISLPLNQIGFGTNTGITSSSLLTFSSSVLNINGDTNTSGNLTIGSLVGTSDLKMALIDSTGKVAIDNNFYYEQNATFNRMYMLSPNGANYLYSYIDNSVTVIESTHLQLNANQMLGLRSDAGYVRLYAGGGVSSVSLRADTNSIKIGDPASAGTYPFQVDVSSTFTTLAGTGSRMVIADSVGTLSTQTIPVSNIYTAGQGLTLSNGTFSLSSTFSISEGYFTTSVNGTQINGYSINAATANIGSINSATIDAGNIISNQFIKTGGTSSQFLKADGSVDSIEYQPLDSDLTSISGLTSSGLLRNTSGTWSIDNTTYISNFYKDVVDSGTVSGTASETLVKSVLIPANTFTAGDLVFVRSIGNKSGTGGIFTVKIRTNTVNDLTGSPTTVGYLQTTGGTTVYNSVQRSMIIKNASTQTYSSSLSTDEGAATTGRNLLSINWTIDQYIIITLQNVSIADTSLISLFTIEKR
jgi:hypothetical protein